MKRLVLVGGGHAHLFVLEDLALRPDERVSVTLVTPHPQLIYTGMLPGYVAGHYALEECAIDLVRLAGRAHASYVQTRAVLLNPGLRELICADGSVFPYDAISFDIGSQAVMGAKGVERNALVLRPLSGFVSGWMRLLAHVKDQGLDSITVVGGGAGGVELSLAIAHRLRRELDLHAPHVRLLTDSAVLLPEFRASVRERVLRALRRYEVGVHADAAVCEVGPGYVKLANGMEFASGATLWVAGAAAPAIFGESGLATDARGFLSVDATLQCPSAPGVFGAGDCATNMGAPRAKAGVFAVRCGPALAANLRAALEGRPLAPFTTRASYLALLAMGRQHAVGSHGALAWEGDWVWRWKDRIDRRFVQRFAATSGS